MSANAARGEAELRVGGEMLVLRPSFQALVAAEGEVGPLVGVVERAAEGRLALSEMVALFWH
ncbi:MAG: gene transfer agent family protein, partial [Sphingomonadales bacterium]